MPVGRTQRTPRRPGRRFIPRRKICSFCVQKVQFIDYKNISRLSRSISDRAKMEPRRKTGVCAKHQRFLSKAIKRARQLALLPFTQQHIQVTGWTRSAPATRGQQPPSA